MTTRRKVQPDPEAVAKAARVAEIRAEESSLLDAALTRFAHAHLEQRLIDTRLQVDELHAALEAARGDDSLATEPKEKP